MRSKSGFSFFYKITSSSRKKPSISISKPSKIPESSGINKTIENAAEIIETWNTEHISEENFSSLFRESEQEAKKFVKRVNELQNAMNLLIKDNPNSENLIRAHKLMQIAMKRLQNEFRQILSTNRAHLDLEPNDEEEEVSKNSRTALKSIAECMISAGYGKECASIYKSIRKSIVDESIYSLGVEKISSSKAKKMPYEALELKMKRWIEAVKVSMKTLFDNEKSLCDEVFESSVSLRESCFRDITKEGAMILFSFPETVAVKDKKHLHMEKIFLLLGMYCIITENLLAIEGIFSFPSMLVIRTQAHSSLSRLSESILSHLVEFESEIRKDSSKIVVSGGGVHPITIFAMDYISKLSNYSNYLKDIFDKTSSSSSAKALLPKSYLDITESDRSSELKVRFAWLILVLLCKIDAKAEMYRDFSMQYIFLANNLQHVVSQVRSTDLKNLLGEDWIMKHVEKVKQFTRMYERLAWGSLVSLCSEINTSEAVEMTSEEANMRFEKFNEMFEKTYESQNECVVSDLKLLEEIRVSIGRKLLPVYRDFYNAHSNAAGREGGGNVRYTPEDIGKRLSEVFNGKGISGNSDLCTADLCFVRTSSTTSGRKKRSSSCRRF